LAFYEDQALKSPFLKIQHLYWSALSGYNNVDIIDFFKQNIDMGYYLFIKIDEYYIPNRSSYKKSILYMII
jgi:hypothetical protein